MIRKVVCLFLSFIVLLSLTSCSWYIITRSIDKENKNIPKITEKSQITGCDVYYDTDKSMSEYLKINQENYTDIVYAAAGVVRSVWVDGDNKFYTVSDNIKENNFSFLDNSISDVSMYSSTNGSSLAVTLDNIKEDRLSVIITDLQSELNDYSSIAELFVKKALKNNLSIGFIGVQLDTDLNNARTFFIIVIADAEDVSSYIREFKMNQTVIAYSGKATDFQKDTVEMINYQIIANQSGIQGIDYENNDFNFVENCFYAGEDGNIDRQEDKGSFLSLRTDYDKNDLYRKDLEDEENNIEGTVNFTPYSQRFVYIDKNGSLTTPKYLGMKSLAYEEKNKDTGKEIAGKIKLNVPFKVINGVKLSKIQCDLDTKVYKSKGNKFETEPINSDIEVVIAEGATAEQGKWRVDDKTNSMILNILVPSAGKLPVDNGDVLKLDITFKQNDTIESVSRWVRNWNDRGCKNLLNLFNSLYVYQKDSNVAENALTIYLTPGEKSITERVAKMTEEK